MTSTELLRMSPLTWLLERVFFALQYISIINLLFKTRIQWQATLDTLKTDEEKRIATARRARRVEAVVLLWWILQGAAMLATSSPGYLGAAAGALVGWRIADIMQAAINIHVFDRLRRGSRPHQVATMARTLILSILNFIELAVCFGVVYAVCGNKLNGASEWIDPYYFSMVTQLTIGYGDIYPTGWLKAVAIMQGLCGFLFGLIVLSRLIALMPSLKPVLDDA